MTILNIHQAASLLGKTPAALRNGYRRWGVPHFRIGVSVMFTQETLIEWVANGMTAGDTTPESQQRLDIAVNPPRLAHQRDGHRQPTSD